MADNSVSAQMRDEWNARAQEDAGYYVAFGRRNQDDAEFFATATDVINGLETELQRVPAEQRAGWKALEIGCGPGRLMRPMARHFAEIHGVDVSDQMIQLAKSNLADLPNAKVYATDGASLRQFADASIDFVYSYAVFQHIPSREVVVQYLMEIHRVLKPGGFARLQFNGLPMGPDRLTTWSGARFSSSELVEFTAMHDFQLLALDGVYTQYMWTTWRKREPGWCARIEDVAAAATPSIKIRKITNAHSSEPVAPSRGRFASVMLWAEGVPADLALNHMSVMVGDSFGTAASIGPLTRDGYQLIKVVLPELEATGLLPVEVHWMGKCISQPANLRVIPPGPTVPRLVAISDGTNVIAGPRIETRLVKLTFEEIAHPDEIEASIDGHPVIDLEFFCTDPRPQRFEVNFRLPEEIGVGGHALEIRVGRRKLAPVGLDVVA
jgi:SAM-dependent methyltransferase